MEFINIARITEDDFDNIIVDIGGSRISEDDLKETELNCDYKLQNALIELKLIEENPSEKSTKQEKLASVFGNETKTIVIDPRLLNKNDEQKYYRALETPIKTALKKASKQLQKTSETLECDIRIVIIINNGLSYMMPDEFEKVAVKCAKNDTSGIDILLVGGVYYFSDRFEMITILTLNDFNIRKENKELVEKIRSGWGKFLDEFMKQNIIDLQLKRDKCHGGHYDQIYGIIFQNYKN